MNRLGQDLAAAAQELSGYDLKSERARSILSRLLEARPYVANTCTIDRTGKMLAVEPAVYHLNFARNRSERHEISSELYP